MFSSNIVRSDYTQMCPGNLVNRESLSCILVIVNSNITNLIRNSHQLELRRIGDQLIRGEPEYSHPSITRLVSAVLFSKEIISARV